MSKWSEWVMDELQERFPDLRGGHCNCRKIARSSRWSEHANCNARDLYHIDWGYSTNLIHQAYLDEVHAFIMAHFDDLSIRTVIWRKRDHFNHIHIDPWPKSYGTPPCAGASKSQWQYPNGDVVTLSKYGSPDPINGYPDLPVKEMPIVADNQTIKRGASGIEVAIVQKALIELGYDLGNWDAYDGDNPWGIVFPVGADGAAGPAFEQGVTKFQEDASLIVTGEADGVTTAFLFDLTRPEAAAKKHSHPVGLTGRTGENT